MIRTHAMCARVCTRISSGLVYGANMATQKQWNECQLGICTKCIRWSVWTLLNIVYHLANKAACICCIGLQQAVMGWSTEYWSEALVQYEWLGRFDAGHHHNNFSSTHTTKQQRKTRLPISHCFPSPQGQAVLKLPARPTHSTHWENAVGYFIFVKRPIANSFDSFPREHEHQY